MAESRGIPCVIYAAKSTQDLRGSIPAQLAECRELIDADPLREAVAEYKDEAVSGYKRDRGQGLTDAIEHCEDLAALHGICELWAQHSDRLARGDGRTARHTVEVALWALKADVRVKTLQDPDTFKDLLYAVVTGQRNNEDSRRKGLATSSGRRRSVSKGEYVGHLPDGYKLHITLNPDSSVTKQMVIDPDREPIIRMIFRLARRGRTCGQIATALNRREYITNPVKRRDLPRPFDYGRVWETLRNPRYAGLSVYKGEVLARDCWPTYVTVRQQDSIINRQRQLTDRRQRAVRETFLLFKLGRCGECASPLRQLAGPPRKDGTVRRNYACASHLIDSGAHKCAAKPMDAHQIEAMLTASITTLLTGNDTPKTSPANTTPEVRDPRQARETLRVALLEGDPERVATAEQQLIATLHPHAVMLREATLTQRRARELKDARALHPWVEAEAKGRTPATRTEAVELNLLLRTWFHTITVTQKREEVTITAARHQAAGPEPVPVTISVDRADWTRSTHMGPRQRQRYGCWPEAELIGVLQAWADTHGHSPTWADWIETTTRPSPLTIRATFKTWNKALKAAGLPPVPGLQPRPGKFGRIDGIKALQAWARKHGRPPYSMEWKRAGPEHPTSATMRIHFGAWPNALKAAGLTAERKPVHRCAAWADEDILQALRTWTEEHGHPPLGIDWITSQPGHPTYGTVRNHFGTWKKGLAAAGF